MRALSLARGLPRIHVPRISVSGTRHSTPKAFGGYVLDGLVMQLDCAHYDVAKGWLDEISKTYKSAASLGGLSVEDDGGIKFTAGYTFSGTYGEVCLKTDDGVTTSNNLTIAANAVVYEVRIYDSTLESAEKTKNAAIDSNRFGMPDGAFCLADGTAWCLNDGTFFVNK